MRWFLRSVFFCGVAMAAIGSWNSAIRAESANERLLPQQKVVEETLRREAQEAIEDRLELLRPALTRSAASEPAYWQSGFVRDAKLKKWLQYSEVQEEAAQDARLKAYAKVRREHPDTIAGHLDVARWCLGQKLDEQARAHLTRIIELDPNQAEARQLLGFRLS